MISDIELIRLQTTIEDNVHADIKKMDNDDLKEWVLLSPESISSFQTFLLGVEDYETLARLKNLGY